MKRAAVLGVITGAGMQGEIDFKEVEQLELTLSNGEDTVSILDTTTALSIMAGSGADHVTATQLSHPTTITVGDGDDTVTIYDSQAPVTVHGDGNGNDTLILDRSAETAALTPEDGASLEDGTSGQGVIRRVVAGDVTFDFMKTVAVKLGEGNDTFTIDLTLEHAIVNVDGGLGDDTINVLQIGDVLDTIVSGGAGDDRVKVVIDSFPKAQQFTKLRLNVETLTVDNTDNTTGVDWTLRNGETLQADDMDDQTPAVRIAVIDTSGADLTQILGGSGQDSLHLVIDTASDVNGVVLGNRVELQTGLQALAPASSSTFRNYEQVIDFAGLPESGESVYDEDDFRLQTSDGTLFVRDTSISTVARTSGEIELVSIDDNGHLDGSGFVLYSVDLAARGTSDAAVTFRGTTLSGGTVEQSFTVTAGTVETLQLGPQFTVLTNVTWTPGAETLVDNIVARKFFLQGSAAPTVAVVPRFQVSSDIEFDTVSGALSNGAIYLYRDDDDVHDDSGSDAESLSRIGVSVEIGDTITRFTFPGDLIVPDGTIVSAASDDATRVNGLSLLAENDVIIGANVTFNVSADGRTAGPGGGGDAAGGSAGRRGAGHRGEAIHGGKGGPLEEGDPEDRRGGPSKELEGYGRGGKHGTKASAYSGQDGSDGRYWQEPGAEAIPGGAPGGGGGGGGAGGPGGGWPYKSGGYGYAGGYGGFGGDGSDGGTGGDGLTGGEGINSTAGAGAGGSGGSSGSGSSGGAEGMYGYWENDRQGVDGGKAVTAGSGGTGQSGNGGANNGSGLDISGGSAGGGGGGGGGGGAGGGGGGGGGGAGEDGALGGLLTYGKDGYGGGGGGGGGAGGHGGEGQIGGSGGSGGGALEILARGRVYVGNSDTRHTGFEARGGSGSAGEDTVAGGLGQKGQNGRDGTSATPAYTKGGDGGRGGDGGNGGVGGDGGGGAGGTIKLYGSILDAGDATVDAGGGSGGNAGGKGRLIVGSNVGLVAPGVVDVGDPVSAVGGGPDPTGVNARTSCYVGPREGNPFLADSPDFLETTPVIAGLAGGAEIFGLLADIDRSHFDYDPLDNDRKDAPEDALVAVFRFDHGVLVNASGQLEASIDYTRFDMVVVVNVTNINLPLPMLGLLLPGSEQLDYAQGLAIDGLGETTSLASLPAGAAWATLVPETDDLLVNASLTFGVPDDPTTPLVQAALNRGTAEFVVSFVSARKPSLGTDTDIQGFEAIAISPDGQRIYGLDGGQNCAGGRQHGGTHATATPEGRHERSRGRYRPRAGGRNRHRARRWQRRVRGESLPAQRGHLRARCGHGRPFLPGHRHDSRPGRVRHSGVESRRYAAVRGG